jgi:hypothetical protein
LREPSTGKAPVDWFLLFLTPALLSLISIETNEYAKYRKTKEQYFTSVEKSWFRDWEDTCPEEIAGHTGIKMLMGIVTKPAIRDYWSTDEMISTPYFGRVMPRNRFQQVQEALHFNSRQNWKPPEHSDYDELYFIRPILDIMNATFRTNFCLGEVISIDESLAKYCRFSMI